MSGIVPSNNSVTAVPLLLFLPLSLFLMALLLPVTWLPSPGMALRLMLRAFHCVSGQVQPREWCQTNLANVDVAGINWRNGKRA